MAANANDLTTNVTMVEMVSKDEALVGGDYSLGMAGGKRIAGHFFQGTPARRGIVEDRHESFARPEPITPVEASNYNNGG